MRLGALMSPNIARFYENNGGKLRLYADGAYRRFGVLVDSITEDA